MFDLSEVSRMGRSQGVWVGLNEEQQVDEVSIALHQGSLQPVPRTAAVDQAATNLAFLALRLSGVPELPVGERGPSVT